MCNFIPEHVFSSILQNGTTWDKARAHTALSLIRQFVYNPAEILQQHLASVVSIETEEEGRVNREIYDAKNKAQLPGVLVRKEGTLDGKDVDVNRAYNGAGKTHEFFYKFFGRDSIDNKGMKLLSTVHYGRGYNNAFWNGNSMTYGDGDGRIFNSFTSAIDIAAHEIGHGVTERTAGLEYYSQPGALNEHFSDVFGSMVKQYSLGQTAKDADWIIGAGLFTKRVNAKGIRSMKEPGTAYDDKTIGKDPQPNHMDRIYKGPSDGNGVHINSGIPNKAFYLASVNVGGHSWEKMGKIWYKVLTTELGKKSQFQDMVNSTAKVAGKLYGTNSVEQKAVIDGFAQVGLKPSKSILLAA